LKKLRKDEKILSQKQLKITTQIENDENKKKQSLWRYISVLLKVLTPFRWAIGVTCLTMSLLIVYSMLVNNIDRLMNSECGWKCGYMLDQTPTMFNPLDWVLRILSTHHERFYNIQLFMDTAFFGVILLYTFICILYGIIKIGINFFSFEIYKIRRRDTMPQALSIVSILVILMMFAFSMQLMCIAPMYVTFGDQMQSVDNKVICNLKQSHLSVFPIS
jgi:LMBR1 domain-containing protein 1